MLEERLRAICNKVSMDENFYEILLSNPSEAINSIRGVAELDTNDMDELMSLFNDEPVYSKKWLTILLFSLIAKQGKYPIPLPPPPPPPIIEALLKIILEKEV